LDGPLPKLCPAVALSRQDGRHSAVALLLKAALIQVSDYRLLGASGYSVKQIFFRSDSFSKLPDRMSDKLSWIFDMSILSWLCDRKMYISEHGIVHFHFFTTKKTTTKEHTNFTLMTGRFFNAFILNYFSF
jgi:hypothetical protein